MCLWCACVYGSPLCVVCMYMWCACMWHSCMCLWCTCVCHARVYVVLMCVVCMPLWCACTSVDMYMEQCQRLTLSVSLDQSPPYIFRFSHLNPELVDWCCLMSQFASAFLSLSCKSWNYTWAGKSTRHFGILISSLPGHYQSPREN